MQAPTTTQGGLAGRDPDERPCPGCGAENPRTAIFCWQCYRRFDPAPAPAGAPARAWPPAPATAWPPAPVPPGSVPHTTRSGSRLGLLGAIVAVTLGVVAAIAFVTLREQPVSFPDSFGGMTRATDAVSEAGAESFRTQADADGLEADMAFYAQEGAPVAGLAWIRGADRIPGGATAGFDEFAEGFTSGSGGSVLPGAKVERAVDGITYVCAPVAGAVPAGLCLWQDEDVFWVLVDVRPGTTLRDAQRLAVAAQDATA